MISENYAGLNEKICTDELRRKILEGLEDVQKGKTRPFDSAIKEMRNKRKIRENAAPKFSK